MRKKSVVKEIWFGEGGYKKVFTGEGFDLQ